MTATVPLELIFHSIDIGLYNDPPTLRILSSTCHAIHSYTHKYLFRTVTLRVGQIQASNIPGFLAIIRRCPSILLAIRNLDMTLGRGTGTLYGRRITELDALCSFMQQELPNITSVYLTIDEWALDRVDKMPQFRTSLSRLLGNPTLSKLTVYGHANFDMSLLGNAKHVVNFTIQTVPSGPSDSIATDALNSNTATQSPPALRPTTFTLYEPRKSVVPSSAYCDLTAVTTFRFHGTELPVQAILGYLARCSSTLTRLEIYLTSYLTYNGRGGPPPPLNLRALFNLRHLTVTLNANFWNGQLTAHSASDFQWIIDALCSLPHSNIVESIRILTRCTTLNYLCNIDWTLFDSLVFGPTSTKSKWTSLKALDLVFFAERKLGLMPLVNEFQDGWLYGTLSNFREKTDALLSVICESRHWIRDYAPEGISLH